MSNTIAIEKGVQKTLTQLSLGRIRSVAQLVEHRSPKPAVGGSSPPAPAMTVTSHHAEVVELADTRS